MKLCRLILIASVIITGYCVALLVSIAPWTCIALVGLLCAVAARRGYRYLSAFGTARWANTDDLRQAGMLEGKGLILGRIAEKPSFVAALCGLFSPRVTSAVACREFLLALQGRQANELVRLSRGIHTAVFSPTGGGKGVSFVIPHLLTCPESTVVVDFKGENARITAEHRRRVFGHKIVMLDPFKVVTQRPDTFNVLEYIDKDSPLAIDDCRDLAEALVVRTGQEREMHWCDSAEVFIAAMTAVMVQYGSSGDRSLQAVRDLLTDPKEMETAIKLLCDSDAWEGMLSRLGNQLTQFKDKELGSTLTTTNRFLRFLDTIAIAESTKSSSFDPAELRRGRMTVYLILPPEHMRAQSPLLRLWIGATLRAVVRGGLQEKNKVHFVLDEAASLGHMDALDDAVDKLRGFGVRLQFYYQSLGQLKKCFPEGQDQTILSNVSQVFMCVNDNDTAKYVSDRLGEETIVVESGGTSSGTSRQVPQWGSAPSSSYSSGSSENWQQQARKLLKPEEVAALSERTAITFTRGVPPLWTTLVRYYEKDFMPPGRWGRLCSGARMFAGAVVILVVTSGLALAMTARSQRPAYAVPVPVVTVPAPEPLPVIPAPPPNVPTLPK